MHNVSQWPNLRHLHAGEPLGGAKGLLEVVSFKKATESMGRGRVANARWERAHYPHNERPWIGTSEDRIVQCSCSDPI